MAALDTKFAGSIPGLYDHYLGPLLFQPYAEATARRVAALRPRRILEIAAGTGIVTEAMAQAVPDAEIVATDLNQAMLDVAAEKVRSDRVSFRPADALDLPFSEDEFDLVVVQFGVMFYPDRVRGHSEARRVLCDGGHYIAVIWDSLAKNPASQIVHDTVASLYPDDPPNFLERTPFGHDELAETDRDLRAAGFDRIVLETIGLESLPTSARDAATGLVAGCPLAAEIEQRDPDGIQSAVDAAAEALRAIERDGAIESRLSAHVATATK